MCPREKRSLSLMRALIIGAGVVGLAIADELTRRGVSVELLEKNGAIGQEASSAAAGILTPLCEAKGPGHFFDLLSEGYRLFPKAAARLQQATGIDLCLRTSGMLVLAFSKADEEELEQEMAWHKEVGLKQERLTAAQVRTLEPQVDGPVRWGLFYPDVSQVDVTQLVAAYGQVVERQGARIRTHTQVKRFIVESDQVVGVETADGSCYADWVVNCAGPWSGFDPLLSFVVPAVPVRGQMVQFRTPSPLVERVVKSPRAYLVQRAPGALIAGTTVEYAGFDKSVTAEGQEAIWQGALEMASGLAVLAPEKAWAALRPGTPDGLPILGATPYRRLLLATGHYRNGILLAPLTGQVVADWITQEAPHAELTPFSVARFLAHVVS